MAADLAKRGVFVKIYDVSNTHVCDLLAEAFRYSHVVFASCTHNNGIFLCMGELLSDLKAHFFQGRKYALVENGSWAPQAGTLMQAEIEGMKNMEQLGETVRILSSVKEENLPALSALAEAIADDYRKN